MTVISLGIYAASIAGAIGLMMMLPRRQNQLATIGALVAATGLGGLWLMFYSFARDSGLLESYVPDARMIYYYVFSLLAIASAVRVITHKKPVFSALWFVMAVLASSGLLLLSGAEFVAFAMIIIYGGAILVTYVFVIMLATQSSESENDGGEEAYDIEARQPWGAVSACFLLLAVLLTVNVETVAFNKEEGGNLQPNVATVDVQDVDLIESHLDNRRQERWNRELIDLEGDEPLPVDLASQITGAGKVSNTERVGVALFEAHPLGLELAGVVLLISLIGAVVIARQRVDEPGKPLPGSEA